MKLLSTLSMSLLALAACKKEPEPNGSTTTTPPPDPQEIPVKAPVLPSQLLIDLAHDEQPTEPSVVHTAPDGTVTDLEPVYTAGGARIGWSAPRGRWDVGTHRVALDPELALWSTPEGDVDTLAFDIVDTWSGDGTGPPAWTITSITWPPGLGGLVLDVVGELVVVPPAEANEDWVLLTTAADCIVYRGPLVSLPDGYALSLAPLEIDVGGEGPLRLYDTELSFSFADDGSEAHGQFRTLADGRELTALDAETGMGPTFICDLLGSSDAPCHRCDPDDAEALCFDAFAPSVVMMPREAPLPFDPLDLPVCGVDVSGLEVPQIEIDFELPPIHCAFETPDLIPDLYCGCASVPGRLGLSFAPVALLWWRRRRR